MHDNHNIATDKLYFTPSISKDCVMETFEEPGYFKVCHLWMPWMLTNTHTHTHTHCQQRSFHWPFVLTIQEVEAFGQKLLWVMKGVHTTETIIRYGWAVSLHPSCTPDPTPSVSPVWSSERWPGMTPLRRLWGTAEPCAPGAAGEGVQHLLGWTTVPCSKEEEGWWQRCRLYWISYAFDSVVVKLHEIVMCVTCKWHEIKKNELLLSV